jgi:hypothetical protein
MIAYDLTCRMGHQFEAWFGNLKTFEAQRRKKLIECPQCGSDEIAMVYRPQAIRKKKLRSGRASYEQAVRKVETFLRENFEDVGSRFAEEARKVHSGEGERRNIRGEATSEEERDLKEEGVPFYRVSFPKPVN